jgi:bacteriocin-like protein
MSEEIKKPAEELSENDLKTVAGGATKIQDMTNNQATTTQKSADKNDALIRQ